MIFRILRLLVGGILALVLIAVFFLAVVFHYPHWLYHYVSPDLTAKIIRRCALTRLAIPSRDSDGDGGPDWYEDWTETDRNDPADGPTHTLLRHGCPDCLYAGERTRMCIYPRLDRLSYRWPSGLILKLSTSAPVLLHPDGSGTPRDELEVAVDDQGYLQFDVVMQPSASGKFPSAISVSIPSPDSTVANRTEQIKVRCYGWRAERLPIRIEFPAREPAEMTLSGPNPPERGFLHYFSLPSKSELPGLQWLFDTEPSPPGWSGAPPEPRFFFVFAPRIWVPYGWTLLLPWPAIIHYPAPTPPFQHIIEVARADQPETWLPMFPIDSAFENTDALGNTTLARFPIKNDFEYYSVDPTLHPDYRGPYIYRIVPVYGLPQYYSPARVGLPSPFSSSSSAPISTVPLNVGSNLKEEEQN